MQREWRQVGYVCDQIKSVLSDGLIDIAVAKKNKSASSSPDKDSVGGHGHKLDLGKLAPRGQRETDTDWIRTKISDALGEFVNRVQSEGNETFFAVLKQSGDEWTLDTTDTRLLFDRFDEVRDIASRAAKEEVVRSDMPMWPL